MTINQIRAEFARRAVQFHVGENLEDITLWGLFTWGCVSKYIKDKRIIVNDGYTKENRVVWCKPSKDEIEKYIRPLINNHSLDALSRLAGWPRI